ncbi:flavin monoamine oxidase family protein [Actimicrobium sp. CCI2.3]|uniref:flavin monoamine oxidase family protein n=1 Tax=Actimicrobium sp. CCI2.3 TaxID=3048616 RepID=UPI002AB354BA|nr:FAD-dependent oxidoreductase [Actimicrobium sp. CCI2.3]MDY7573031.1 FAD-dependent oxidoreductase [Actimicrobium sp. CCI2.3]MEB0020828.1 FAD-dependent oxidoreductase [Actimicrobium sp. CCI2.3]
MGGGLAGMVAALRLEQAGSPYLLLEAQTRFGGRILSQPVAADAGFGVDLGPTWFWPHQQRMRRLCAELECAVFAQHVDGDVLYQQSSVQPVQRSGEGEGMLSYRVEGGTQSLIAALTARLDPARVHRGCPITGVARGDDGWCVTSDDATGAQRQFRAQHLVLAAPPRKLLQIDGLAQCLPTGLPAALMATPTWMASQAKFVAVYPAPFWREDGLSGQAFSRVGPMVEIHDASATADTGFALFGFIGVPAEVRSQHTTQTLQDACLRQLVSVFGAQAATPDVSYLKDWAREAWIVSAEDIGEPPRHPELDLSVWLPQLHSMQLHVVGSEVAPDEGGYLEGALGSVEALMRTSGLFA